MPRRSDLKTILIIGSGPIIIGQACEFDYSGSQACKVLREEGYRVILINSNPATIMTDPEMADEIYIEPVTPPTIEKIIKREKVDAILPTVGGQTALNTALQLKEAGILDRLNVELIGADEKAIARAENRELFASAMDELGYATTKSFHVRSLADAKLALTKLSLPLVIRPSFTLGGSGGATVLDATTYFEKVATGLRLSRTHEVLVEKSIVGWKEFELEVMKDHADNTVIICSIENIDPIGIHTGDSITVAPQLTLSDRLYQKLRNMSIAIMKKIGVATGGANVQFAIHPKTEEIIVIEMNPRVSRSSALASKATGFPIAKIAAKLAVGYRLDEIENDITQSTPACFEPSIDYVVVKIPRFTFEKFSHSSPKLGIQMKSVGETMAIGRTFQEAIQKAIRGLETSSPGFDGDSFRYTHIGTLSPDALKAYTQKQAPQLPLIKEKVQTFHHQRLALIKDLFFLDVSCKEIHELSGIDPFFIHQLKEIFDLEMLCWKKPLADFLKSEIPTPLAAQDHKFPEKLPPEACDQLALWTKRQRAYPLRFLKARGFSDVQLALFFNVTEDDIRRTRHQYQIRPSYKVVDTCAGEFLAQTPYYYSTYDEEDELQVFLKQHFTPNPHTSNKTSTPPPPTPAAKQKRIVILGGGPNRIGQGIEFDYMCVQASLELRQMGHSSIIINSNPETVSTDYDVSSLLFFEPLTHEDTLEVIHAVAATGVIVHLGGQTSLNLSTTLAAAGVTIMGTQQEAIFNSEDRKSFKGILHDIKALQPESEAVFTYDEVKRAAERIGFPVLIRPSFVLGGRAMRIAHHHAELKEAFALAKEAAPPVSILVDKYLEGAYEVDVDLISDGHHVIICGILEHIEEAGIHSGDSACFLPPQNISKILLDKIISQSKELAKKLRIIGLMNIQFALYQDQVYFLEANPRGSRTIPFVSKATGISWVRLAVRAMMGETLTPITQLSAEGHEQPFDATDLPFISLKEAVLPFNNFPEEDPLLGPEMKSTGEVMGIGKTLAEAFYKTMLSVHNDFPQNSPYGILISLRDKPEELSLLGEKLTALGFKLYATPGTHRFLKQHHINSHCVEKLPPSLALQNLSLHHAHPIIENMLTGKIRLVFNTPTGTDAKRSDAYIRIIAQKQGIAVFTTFKAISCAVASIIEGHKRHGDFPIYSMREIVPRLSHSPVSPLA